MRKRPDFEKVDYLQVFGKLPTPPSRFPYLWGMITSMLIGMSVMVLVTSLLFLGSVAILGEACVRTHIIESSDGQVLSVPHERNEKGYIIDFGKPTGFGQ